MTGPTSIEFAFNGQPGVDTYQVTYLRIGGVLNICPDHTLRQTVNVSTTRVTLNNLEEDSRYSITISNSGVSIIIATDPAGNVYTK